MKLSDSGFTIRPYRMKRLKAYANNYSQPSDKVLCDDRVESVLKAQGYQVDENPRSIYDPDKLYEALHAYRPKAIPDPVPSDHFRSGISLAYACFARKKDKQYLHVLPFNPATIDLITSNPSGSPGLTAWGSTKAESKSRALERGLQTISREKQPEPCLAFKRTQFNGKTRLVWGYPYSMTAIEGLVAHPLNEMFKQGLTPMAYSMPSGVLGTKLVVASYHNKYAYSLDMSQFDATISSQLIHIAFNIMRTWFDLDETEPVSGATVKQIFNLIEYYFIHTTIVMPDLNIYIGKDHGVPSGSYFTQMVDSIVNTIICGAISSRFHFNVSKREVFVLGDDLLFWTDRMISLDVIAKWANENFHVKLHGPEKSAIYRYDQPIHYVGRDWENGLPTLDEQGILQRMQYPERFRKYSDNPKEAHRQVRMMLLQFASQYKAAWNIAFRAVDSSGWNIKRGCANADVNTYLDGSRSQPDPDFMSGLARYRYKYGGGREAHDIPITALQFWL